jgi:hypothetical protein
MPPEGFEPAIPATERPQTHALDRAAADKLKKIHLNRNINIEIIIMKYNVQSFHVHTHISILRQFAFTSPVWSKCNALKHKGNGMLHPL